MLCYSTTLSNALNAPSNLKATALSASRINLRWTDNAEFESGFKALGVPDTYGLVTRLVDMFNFYPYTSSGPSAG